MQVPNWSSLGRLKRSRFPNLGGGGHQFGGGAGAGALSGMCCWGWPCRLPCKSPVALGMLVDLAATKKLT